MAAFSPIHLGRPFKVLCIEDEPEILRDLAEELAEHGFCVGQAASAEAALPQMEREAPDLVICDMQMPGMSGIDLLRALRARSDALARVPFVFLTAFGDRETAIDGRRAGADDYLVKPVDYDLLIAAVESHLRNAMLRFDAAQEKAAATCHDERAALLDHLAQAPANCALAVIKIDTQHELTRRFTGDGANHLDRVIGRLARRRGMPVFRLHSHAWATTADSECALRRALEPLIDLRLRDRWASAKGSARISLSVVDGLLGHAASPTQLLDRLMEAARLVQREGGGKMLPLEGPELAEIRLATMIRSELVGAIRQGQLHVLFQPKVGAGDGLPQSAEVLVRWESPLLGNLSPARFIPVVERAGLLPHLTDWVLQQAANAQVMLRAQGLPARLAVNIGASEFTHGLPERIGQIFAACGADESLLEVEVTETSVLKDPATADAIVKALHARGIAVALDDFGTGFSSLAHLQNWGVDTIKIDRSFVNHVTEAGPDQTIVLGIIGIARTLGMAIVAEGVELEAQRTWLMEHDCDVLQGYAISHPLPLPEYCALLAEWGLDQWGRKPTLQ